MAENKRIPELPKNTPGVLDGEIAVHNPTSDVTERFPMKELGGGVEADIDWDSSQTYNIGEIVRSSGNLLYSSDINSNATPPSDGVNWTIKTASIAHGVISSPHANGVFTVINSVVTNTDGSFYILNAAPPFESTDFAAEITGGDWIVAPLAPQAFYDFTGAVPSHVEGRMYYDITKHNHVLLNDVVDVALDLGLELWVRVFNDTGSTITNGKICYVSGVNVGSGLQEVTLAQADSVNTSDVIGFATHDIEDQTIGYIVAVGELNEVNTVGFTLGSVIYLSPVSAGDFVETNPLPPDQIVPVGRILNVDASGKIFVRVGNIISPTKNTISAGFNSAGGVTNVDNYILSHYIFGGSVTPSGPGDNLGSANEAHGSRAFIVLSGASTDMIIQVTGDTWDGQTETLANTQDIDTSGGIQDQYYEAPIPMNGIVNFALLSGTPVDINIGFVHYEGNGTTRFILTDVTWSGVAGAADAGADFQVIPHSPIGWTYTGSGAIPPTPVIDMQNQISNGAFVNGDPFTFTVTGYSDVIRGDQNEGLVTIINYNNNSSITTSNILFTILN